MGTRRRRVIHTRPCCLPIGLGSPRSARPAMMNKPLRRPEPVVETGRDQKSPLRRCFKPRPPLRTGYAGFASGCRSSVRSSNNPATLRSSRSRSGRLSGLLSGCPPTDTRPQARAKLGKAQLSDPIGLRKFFAHRISAPFNEMCTHKAGKTLTLRCSAPLEQIPFWRIGNHGLFVVAFSAGEGVPASPENALLAHDDLSLVRSASPAVVMLRAGGASSNHGERSSLLGRPLARAKTGLRVDSTSIHRALV